MTTAAPTTALVMIQPAFTDAERLALAGYLGRFGERSGQDKPGPWAGDGQRW